MLLWVEVLEVVVLVEKRACLFNVLNYSLDCFWVKFWSRADNFIEKELLFHWGLVISIYVVFDIDNINLNSFFIFCNYRSKFFIKIVVQLVYLSLLFSNKLLLVPLYHLQLLSILIRPCRLLTQHTQRICFHIHEHPLALLHRIHNRHHLMMQSQMLIHTYLTNPLLLCFHQVLDLLVDVVLTRVLDVGDPCRVWLVEVNVLDCLRTWAFCTSSLVLAFETNWSYFRATALIAIYSLKIWNLLS